VPLPIGNGEQFVNAASLVADDRAEVVSQKEFTADYLNSRITALLAKSAAAPMAGNGADLHAAEKIVALTEFAMKP
jgi:UDP-N-acetylglucosamine--N-acetylmuramyl-(pentapeptide) pyrophosphoryl-undecaprenol N-acetylglucosamine transferase